MTLDFITLFDSSYLAQGLSMTKSLLRTTPRARIWIVAGDDRAMKALRPWADSRVRVVPLSGVETPELRCVRPSRTRVEYYWTLTPFLPSYVFRSEPTSEVAVYVDADMFFFSSAQRILNEFIENRAAAAMITPHDYLPEYDQTATSGRYCVQFMPFRRVGGERILSDWQSQCLEWCFRRVEPGRFGDQKYLDQWSQKFGTAVHVQESVELLGAPWNAGQRDPGTLVAYHFHGLRRISRRYFALHPGYNVPRIIRTEVYMPYLHDLSKTLNSVGSQEGMAPRLSASLAGRILKDSLSTGLRSPAVARTPNALTASKGS